MNHVRIMLVMRRHGHMEGLSKHARHLQTTLEVVAQKRLSRPKKMEEVVRNDLLL